MERSLKTSRSTIGWEDKLNPLSSSVRWTCILVFLSLKNKLLQFHKLLSLENGDFWGTTYGRIFTRDNGSLKGIISDVLRFSQKHVQIVHVVTCFVALQSLKNVRKARLVRAITIYLQEARNMNKQRRVKVLLWLTALIFLEQA